MTRAFAARSRSSCTTPLGLAALALASTIATDACVIADPPTDLPVIPEMRPVFVRGSVVPSVSAVLGRWPDKFIVPVELVDPRSKIFFSAFVDYNPATGEGLDSQPQTSEFAPSSSLQNGRVRT